jgi:hypothetical protein
VLIVLLHRELAELTVTGEERYSKPMTIDNTMTEADFSGGKLGISGAIIVSAFIPKW